MDDKRQQLEIVDSSLGGAAALCSSQGALGGSGLQRARARRQAVGDTVDIGGTPASDDGSSQCPHERPPRRRPRPRHSGTAVRAVAVVALAAQIPSNHRGARAVRDNRDAIASVTPEMTDGRAPNRERDAVNRPETHTAAACRMADRDNRARPRYRMNEALAREQRPRRDFAGYRPHTVRVQPTAFRIRVTAGRDGVTLITARGQRKRTDRCDDERERPQTGYPHRASGLASDEKGQHSNELVWAKRSSAVLRASG